MWARILLRYGTILCLLFSTTALAKEVGQNEARTVAQNWLHHLTREGRFTEHPAAIPQIIEEEVIVHNNTVVGYNFILHPRGHMIVPLRDELPPVKLYSDTATLRMADMSEVAEWIKEELFKLNEAMDAHKGELDTIDHATTHNGGLWSLFGAGASSFPQAYERASPGVESLSIGPLLSTTWNQSAPYNMYTPLWYTGEATVTGCVATAAAQIMKYWNFPPTGQGSTSYSWSNGSVPVTLSRVFSTSTYNWGLMKNNHTTVDTSAEKDAVARLMSDVGIAFQMVYGPASSGGSGASTMYGVTVFPTYFRYANTISGVYRTNYGSDSAWMQVFKNEAQNGRPSQLRLRDPAAGGHSVVVDGYRDSPSEQIHINFGWGGSYDGWYVTNNIVTGGYSWSDVNYQAAVIGISPTPLPTVTSVTATPSSPRAAGTPITVTATATGGTDSYQFKWWVWNGSAWSVGQDWNTSTTFVWTPQAAGTYELHAWVRNSGVTADTWQAWGRLVYTVTTNLAAYQPPGWSDALVVAAVSGSKADAGTYVRGQTYYLNAAVGNYGTGAILGRYYVAF
jgi:hypothetical protein